jgi:hypothetical protein
MDKGLLCRRDHAHAAAQEVETPETADGPFRSIRLIGLRATITAVFAGTSEADADRDSIRGHHDRFVCWRRRLVVHSPCN